MKTLAAIGILCALLQEKAPVTIAPEAPTETAWPISGRCQRPNGTVVKIQAVRVERRWEPTLNQFREFTPAESRLMKSAEVDGRAFRANLKFGPTGVYDISVNESEQRLGNERHVLGHPASLFAATKKSLGKLNDLCDRASADLDQIQKVLTGKQPGTAKEKDAFIKKVYADEQLVQELAGKTDLTGSTSLLNEILGQIRNAQVWELSGGRATAEQQNDGEGAGHDVFLDPKLNFKILHETIGELRSVISQELVLSTASILDALYARAENRPEKVFLRARDLAIEAIQVLSQAPVEDKDARAVIEAAAGAIPSGIAEARKSLQVLMSKYRVEQP
jgi:hypothetical protein